MIDPTYTFQPSTADAYMSKKYPDTADGSYTYLNLDGYASGTGIYRAILKFDMSSQIPAGVTINSATLSLYYYHYASNNPSGRTWWAYRITQTGWVETTVTWNSYDTGHYWAAAGGGYTATDGASVTAPGSYGWVTWAVTAQVQTAVTSVGRVAHFLIRDGDEGASASYIANFYSREYSTDTSLRPKLYVDWTSVTTKTVAYGIDMALRKLGLTTTAGFDVALRRLLLAAYGIDVTVERFDLTVPHGLDVALQKLGLTQPMGMDAVLRKIGLTQDAGIDLVLKMIGVTQVGIDAALQKLGLTAGEGIDVVLHNLGLSLQEGIDVVLKKIGVADAGIDTVIVERFSTPVSIDVALQQLNLTKDMGIDMLIGQITARELGIDVSLLSRGTPADMGLDAALAKIGLTTQEGIDIVLQKLGLAPAAIDIAVLQLSQAKPMGIAAALRQLNMTTPYGIDLNLLSHDLTVMGIDAALRKQNLSQQGIDAALKLFNLTAGAGIGAVIKRFDVPLPMAIDIFLKGLTVVYYGIDSAIKQSLKGLFGIDVRITFAPAKVIINLGIQTFGPNLSIQTREVKVDAG